MPAVATRSTSPCSAAQLRQALKAPRAPGCGWARPARSATVASTGDDASPSSPSRRPRHAAAPGPRADRPPHPARGRLQLAAALGEVALGEGADGAVLWPRGRPSSRRAVPPSGRCSRRRCRRRAGPRPGCAPASIRASATLVAVSVFCRALPATVNLQTQLRRPSCQRWNSPRTAGSATRRFRSAPATGSLETAIGALRCSWWSGPGGCSQRPSGPLPLARPSTPVTAQSLT